MGWKWFDDLKAGARTKMAQFNNAKFKDAAMASCALIAAADGNVSPEEKSKVAAFITKSELLASFNPAELRDLFLAHCEKAGDDFSRLDLINLVRKVKGDEAAASTALKVALVIANADGDFSDSEKKVVRELCQALGQSPADYGV
jgi:tellurite resistance protein TerB